MSFTSAAALLAFIGCTSAFPQFGQPNLIRQVDDHAWIAPGPGDVRSPCPGTNTLANHGYINRSGRGVSKQAYIDAWAAAFGFDQSGVVAGCNNAINLCSQTTGTTCQTFDLDMLNVPHQIEHDASLTRLDREMAYNLQSNNFDFNATVWEETMESYCDATHIDYSLANTARLNRIAQAKRDDAPGWFVENDGGSLAEHAFTISSMADESSPAADGSPQYRLDWVDYWFRNERLPTALGWAKPSAPIMADALNSIAARVNSAPTASACTKSSSSTSMTSIAGFTNTAVGPATTSSCTESTGKIYPTMKPHYTNSSMPAFRSKTETPATTTPVGYPTTVVTTSLSAYTTTKTITSYTTISHSKSEMTSPVYIPNTIVGYSTVVIPATTETVQPYNSAEASKTSSAEALATQIAGPAPSPLNAYNQTHSSDEWKANQGATDSYCSHVGAIAQGIIGTFGNAGSFGSSGSNPASYGGMGGSGSSSSGSGSVLCFCPA